MSGTSWAAFIDCFSWLPLSLQVVIGLVFTLFIVGIVLRFVRFILELIPFV